MRAHRQDDPPWDDSDYDDLYDFYDDDDENDSNNDYDDIHKWEDVDRVNLSHGIRMIILMNYENLSDHDDSNNQRLLMVMIIC